MQEIVWANSRLATYFYVINSIIM